MHFDCVGRSVTIQDQFIVDDIGGEVASHQFAVFQDLKLTTWLLWFLRFMIVSLKIKMCGDKGVSGKRANGVTTCRKKFGGIRKTAQKKNLTEKRMNFPLRALRGIRFRF